MIDPCFNQIGIAAIAAYEPPRTLGNDWFNGTLSRKFVQHTGIQSRHVSSEDEVTMGVRAVEQLRRETGCNLQDCAAVVFVSPSFVPISIAQRYMDGQHAFDERLDVAARLLVAQLGFRPAHLMGINWFCSGYGMAMSLIGRHIAPRSGLAEHQFMLVVTASRISRITDYGCQQTGPLFGDMATATLLARTDSRRYPVHFKLAFASAEMRPADSSFFRFHLRENVLAPTPDGGHTSIPQRLVFSLDGMGIGDTAPRAMASALTEALQATHTRPDSVRFVVPHQAGVGIVRLATMKLEECGVHAEVVNGLTREIGNVSSSSVPYALRSLWPTLDGTIACPLAGVGAPDRAEVSQGCILLEATQAHKNMLPCAQ
jgi:3-oxoacyl-[acyl-carrier-protein] synthase III